MEEISWGEIEAVLDEVLGMDVGFRSMAEQAMSGEQPLALGKLPGMVQDFFFKELLVQKSLFLHIMILVILAAVLLHFADIFENKTVSQISFYIIYLLLFLLLLTSFQNSVSITEGVLQGLKSFMTVLAPAWFLVMTMSSYVRSAGIYYEFILFLISAVQWLMGTVILPFVSIYILIMLVNQLSGEKRLGNFADLLSLAVGWSLKASLALVCGFHMIQGLIAPAADSFRTMSLGKGMEMIPGIGNAGSSTTELLIGSVILIKNGIGAAALVVLLLICLVPIVKLAVIMLVYYLLAAVLQPVADERMTGCLLGMGNGVRLLLQAVFSMLAMFLLTVALTAAMTGR